MNHAKVCIEEVNKINQKFVDREILRMSNIISDLLKDLDKLNEMDKIEYKKSSFYLENGKLPKDLFIDSCNLNILIAKEYLKSLNLTKWD